MFAKSASTIHWNLFIADMLYRGHLVVADTISSNWQNQGQILTEKAVFSRQLIANTRCNGHIFLRLWRKINLAIICYRFGSLLKTIMENNDQSIQNKIPLGPWPRAFFLWKITKLLFPLNIIIFKVHYLKKNDF